VPEAVKFVESTELDKPFKILAVTPEILAIF
jgi:hypothetical protein